MKAKTTPEIELLLASEEGRDFLRRALAKRFLERQQYTLSEEGLTSESSEPSTTTKHVRLTTKPLQIPGSLLQQGCFFLKKLTIPIVCEGCGWV